MLIKVFDIWIVPELVMKCEDKNFFFDDKPGNCAVLTLCNLNGSTTEINYYGYNAEIVSNEINKKLKE